MVTKYTWSTKLPEDTIAVLRDVSKATGIPQAVIVDTALCDKLVEMMAEVPQRKQVSLLKKLQELCRGHK